MPTIKIGNNTGDDYTGTIFRGGASGNPTLPVVGVEMTTEAGAWFIWAKGDVPGVLAGKTIVAATLYLWKTTNGYTEGAGQTLAMHRCLRTVVPNEMTWNSYSAGNAWATPGALGDGTDRVATPAQTAGPYTYNSTAGYRSFASNAATIALWQGWVDATFPNDGALLPSNGGELRWESQIGTDGHRPYWEIEYSDGGITGTGAGYAAPMTASGAGEVDSGPASVTLTNPLASAGFRLRTMPDLAAGDIVEYEIVSGSGTIAVNVNGSFVASAGVLFFQYRVNDGGGFGSWVLQEVRPQGVRPATMTNIPPMTASGAGTVS